MVVQTKFSQEQIDLLHSELDKESLRVLQASNNADLAILSQVCSEVDPCDDMVKLLIKRLYATVSDPKRPGVGIASPQIGISKRVFLAQRFDKKDKPFEFFVNPEITWYSTVLRLGEEGCLSIENIYEKVYRSMAIEISYFDLEGKKYKEIIEGFTAVILQHEMDHLNGILFPLRVEQDKDKDIIAASEQDELFYFKENRLSR
ncbi:peptide deformylase [Myroides sp. LJL116]